MKSPLIGLALVVSLSTGCSQTSELSSFEQAPDSRTTEERFLDTIHQTQPSTQNYDDDAVVGVAKLACDVFDEGGTSDDLLSAVLQTDFGVEDAGVIIGAGVGAFCPEHTSKTRG